MIKKIRRSFLEPRFSEGKNDYRKRQQRIGGTA